MSVERPESRSAPHDDGPVRAVSRDRATPPAWNRAIADSIPGGRYAELDGAHLIHVEDEARFTALVGAELG